MTREFVNGKVFTGLGENTFASAFRVENGRFTWVGDGRHRIGDEVIDLGGRTVLPGLLDIHTHPAMVATLNDTVDCLPPRVTSLAEMKEQLRRHPAFGRGPDRWVVGNGYDDTKFAGGSPTARDLDGVSAEQPILVLRCDAHSGVCNSRALELAGITATTPDPAGACFGRNPSGSPNGILTEIAAVRAVQAAMPRPDLDDWPSRIAALNDHYLSHGIVAMCDLQATIAPEPLGVFRSARVKGFRPKVGLYLAWDTDQELPDLSDADRSGDVRIAGLKLFMDGAYSNRTAWVSEAYPGSCTHGMRTLSDDQAAAAITWAQRNKVQVAFHAMGDCAVAKVLELCGDLEPWLDGIPSVRIEHATLLSPVTLRRIREARVGIGVVTQMIFFYAEYESYDRNLTERQRYNAYPIRSAYQQLDHTALSSDSPATAWSDADDVFTSIKAAVQRRSYTGGDLGQGEAVSVPQALLLYTARANSIAGLGDIGTIDANSEASFIVLDRDIFTVPTGDIDQIHIDETWLSGECVYRRSITRT